MSPKDFGPTIAIALSQGAFAGLSAKGAVLAVRDKVNKKFYGRAVTPDEILYEDGTQVPDDKPTSAAYLKNIYTMLDKLSEGAVVASSGSDDATAVDVTEAETSAAMDAAAAAEAEHKDDPEVVMVDAAAEAEKEKEGAKEE